MFPESKDLLFARATDLPPGDCCRASAESRSLDSARSSASGRPCCARDDRGEVGSTMEFVCRGVRSSYLSQRARKMGHPFLCGGVGKVHGSFVGSPWLCQGLRCLRMTAFLGRMRPFDNSPEMRPSVCWLPLFKIVILSGGNGLACEFVPGVERPAVCPCDGLAAG